MNRVAKHTLRFAAVLAVIVLAVVLLVSPVATWLVNRYGEQWTGRQIEVESVSVNVFAGTVKARNLNVSESVPDDGRFIHVGRLYADLRMTALLQKTIKLDSLYFGHFFVRIDQDSDRFNFTDLIERFASSDTIQDETESAADTTKSGWGVILSHIKFENSAVHYRDIPLSARFDLKDISLYIPEINLSTMRTMMGLDFEFEEGGTFGTQLVYDDATHNYDLQLWVNQVPLTYGLPYMRQYLYADSVQGTISTELRILGNTDHLIQLDLSGKVNGHDWALYSNDSLPIIQFDSVEVALRGINLSNKELKMGNLALSGLQTSYTLFDDSTTNWSRIVLPDDDEWVAADSSDLGNMPEEELMEAEIDVEAFPEDSIPWHLVVDRMAISHVALNYADSTMSPAFRYGVSDLTVDVRNFDTDKINTANVLARLQQKRGTQTQMAG